MRGVFRDCLEGFDHDLFDNVIADGSGRAGPWFIDQSVEALLTETFTPLRHRGRVAADLACDLLAGQVRVFAQQDDLAAHREVLCCCVSARPTLQLSSFCSGERDLDRWSSSSGHGVPFDAGGYTNNNAS